MLVRPLEVAFVAAIADLATVAENGMPASFPLVGDVSDGKLNEALVVNSFEADPAVVAADAAAVVPVGFRDLGSLAAEEEWRAEDEQGEMMEEDAAAAMVEAGCRSRDDMDIWKKQWKTKDWIFGREYSVEVIMNV